MRWLNILGMVVTGSYGVWLLLLAYRVVGKPRGQDANYDASIDYWSGTFKVIGFLAILAIFLEAADFLIEWWS